MIIFPGETCKPSQRTIALSMWWAALGFHIWDCSPTDLHLWAMETVQQNFKWGVDYTLPYLPFQPCWNQYFQTSGKFNTGKERRGRWTQNATTRDIRWGTFPDCHQEAICGSLTQAQGTVTSAHRNPRSYLVSRLQGTHRRNRHHLVPMTATKNNCEDSQQLHVPEDDMSTSVNCQVIPANVRTRSGRKVIKPKNLDLLETESNVYTSLKCWGQFNRKIICLRK